MNGRPPTNEELEAVGFRTEIPLLIRGRGANPHNYEILDAETGIPIKGVSEVQLTLSPEGAELIITVVDFQINVIVGPQSTTVRVFP